MDNKAYYLKKSLAMTLPTSAFLFMISGVITDLNKSGTFTLENYGFTKMALGSLIIGLGFGLPAFIYGSEKISPLLKTLFHMGIGCAVMIVTGLLVGWIPTDKGPSRALIMIGAEIALAAIIWAVSYFRYKKIARQMTEKIKAMKE